MIMATFDCPSRFIDMVWQFHDGIQARVQNDGKYSGSIYIHLDSIPTSFQDLTISNLDTGEN